MEPVLIYTDASFVDVGAIQTFSLDMAFGSDEQDFEISFSRPELKGGELLYIDGTEYGGIIDNVTHSTESEQTIYKGRTWHGMLAGKIVKPPTGSDYYTLSGDANTCIRSLLSYVELDDVLTGRTSASGITVNYQFNRFTNAYNGLLRMLSDAGAVLRIERHDGITELWAEQRVTIEDEADSDLMDFAITDSVRVPNHLVAAGEGDLQERVVVDLYADADGNVSQTQTLFGVDEIAVFYNYNNADRDELISDGTKELQEYQQGGGADLQVNSRGDWHVGDSIRVRDNRRGLVITSTIAKKIVKVERGVMTVDYEIGDAAAQSYGGGATAETNLVTPIANGGTGATTTAGALANLGALPKIPPGSSALPRSTATSNVFPIVLGNTFANNGQISYQNIDDFKKMLDLTVVSSTTIADVITVNSNNATISSVDYKQWGKVASLRFTWKNKNAISVPASGNIADIVIGTVVSGKRPANNQVNWKTDGNNAGAAWGYINSSGTIDVGAFEGTGVARTIAADSTLTCHVTYIVA